uniref:TIR domain-containing protein n=1 Tax=Leptobrachium leishanense TaxID=445787 RepID=A0A8C5LST1_9ANUR
MFHGKDPDLPHSLPVKNSNKDSELNENCNEFPECFTPLSSSEVGISSVGKNTISDTMACLGDHKSDCVPTGVPKREAPSSTLPGNSTAPNSTSDLTPYYRFVIFHSPEDNANADRVCQRLSDLGAVGGTTFSNSFEIPGKSPIACTETAIEKSAYIIILLTEGFANNWTKFQSNTALMNSIQDPEKCATVIPFLPQIGRIGSKVPLCLKTLIALDENSQNFEYKVLNTFKLDESVQRIKEVIVRKPLVGFFFFFFFFFRI